MAHNVQDGDSEISEVSNALPHALSPMPIVFYPLTSDNRGMP
jgi:hypothetical protein